MDGALGTDGGIANIGDFVGAIPTDETLAAFAPSQPWEIEMDLTFGNVVPLLASFVLYVGVLATPNAGVSVQWGTFLGDMLLHAQPYPADPQADAGPAVAANPQGQSVTVKATYDGTDIRVFLDAVLIVGPTPYDLSMITDPSVTVGTFGSEHADDILCTAVRIRQL